MYHLPSPKLFANELTARTEYEFSIKSKDISRADVARSRLSQSSIWTKEKNTQFLVLLVSEKHKYVDGLENIHIAIKDELV